MVNAQCGDFLSLLREEHFYPLYSLLLNKSRMRFPLLCLIHQHYSLFPRFQKIIKISADNLLYISSMVINLFLLLTLK